MTTATAPVSFALRAARNAGFATVEEHRAAKRAEAEAHTAAVNAAIAAEKAARLAARVVTERVVNVLVSRDLGEVLGLGAPTVAEISERDVLEMFDAADLRGDVLYRRAADGRVTRVLW